MSSEFGYLIRLDDACPTNDLMKWGLFESFIDKLGIKPIVAIIPFNQDPSLLYAPQDEFFWERVAMWRDKGWYIALHGYDHKHLTSKGGLVPLNSFSEFAGVDISIQREKIRNGYQTMKKHGITPTIWVAPWHAFDRNTLKIIREETDIRIISDGIACYPFSAHGFLWIPQQLWGLEENKRKGIWTICIHPDHVSEKWLLRQMQLIEKYRDCFNVSIPEIQEEYGARKRDLRDHLFRFLFFLRRDIQPLTGKINKVLRLLTLRRLAGN